MIRDFHGIKKFTVMTCTDVTANGVTLHVTGWGEGKPVLFCHGFRDTARTWRRQSVVYSREYRRSKKVSAYVAPLFTLLLWASAADAQQSLAEEGARAIVQPIYDALTASSPEDVRVLLEAATAPDWRSCGANDSCEPRDAVIRRWSARVSLVPDMRWELKEILVSGNRVIVRGEDTGTPSGPFLGVDPAGRSFRVMTLDVHEVAGGKVVRTYHVEDWGRARRQLRGDPG